MTKLGGSLAYSTLFSMAPLLVLIMSLFGIFLSREAVEGKIYHTLVGFVGADTAAQLQQIIKNACIGNNSKIAAIIVGVTLVAGATPVFSEIQDSINTICGLKPQPGAAG